MATTTVTLLFTDLVGSTESLSRIGADRAEIIRREHFGLLRESVREHGGREVKNVGDGLMVAFDAVTNALWCAAAMQQALQARNRMSDEPLLVRVGIATGEADVEAGDYFGVPVVEAARLCARANGGEILTSDVVRVLAGSRGGFEFESLGDLELKGLDAPVKTLRVRWMRSAAPYWRGPLPSRLATTDRDVFVGRALERARLADALKQVVASRSRRVVLVSGEAGIGKTSLVGAFGHDAYDAGTVVLYGHSDEDLVIPYQPWGDLLGELVDVAPESLLSAHVVARGGDLLPLVPALRDRVADVPAARSSDLDAERYLLFGAAVDLFKRASAQAPIIVLLDDLHWADRGTLQLLRHLVASSLAMPLLLVGAFRESEVALGHPLTDLLAGLHREEAIERLVLRGFDDVELRALMEIAAGHEMDSEGLALRDELAAETDGNPFFVIEILRHLAETGAIEQRPDGRWRAHLDLRERGLPISVREVVGRRIARLGEDARQVLSVAAVIGREFDLPLLAAAGGFDDDRLVDLMDAATGAVVVAAVVGENDCYAFTHALIHRAIYDDMSAARRRRLHERVAEALEASPLGASRVSDLARHWYEAAQPVSAEKAYDYAMAAGDAARQRLAPDEAARWYAQAVDLTDRLDGESLRCKSLVRLGDAQRLAGDPVFRQTLLDAAWLARDLGDAERLVGAALANTRGFVSVVGEADRDRIAVLQAALDAVAPPDVTTRARLLARLSYETHYIDDIDTQALIDEAVALTEDGTDEAARADALTALHLYFMPSTLTRRLGTLGECERLAAGGDPLRRARLAMSVSPALWQAGDVAGVRRHQDRLREAADELGDPSVRWVHTWLEQIGALVETDFDRAERLATQALQEGLDAGQPDALLFYGAQLTALRSEQGRAEEIVDTLVAASAAAPGIPVLRTGVALMHANVGHLDEAHAILDEYCARGLEQEIGASPLEMCALGTLAGAAGLVDHVEMARLLIPRFEPYRDQLFFAGVSVPGPVALMIGSCARVVGNFELAEREFRQSLQIAERVQGPYWIALTKLLWSQLLLERDGPSDREQAREMLAAVLETSVHHGFPQLERRAREYVEGLA